MTWKTTAAASGLMVVATWLASHAPVGGPREPTAAAPAAARTETAAATIQREADRLHDRVQQIREYRQPLRNPFRFGAPVRPAAAHAPAPAIAAPVSQPPLEAPAPRISLSGIGEDYAGDEVVRTAVISTPENVYVVKVGDAVGASYTVTKIDAAAVELLRLEDGSTLTLSLRP